jgi:hypothetical protein
MAKQFHSEKVVRIGEFPGFAQRQQFRREKRRRWTVISTCPFSNTTHSSSCGNSIRTLHVFAFFISCPGVEADQAVILEAFLLIGEFPPNETRCLSPELTFVIDRSAIPLLILSPLPRVLCTPDDPVPVPDPTKPLVPLLLNDLSVPVLLAPGVKGAVCGLGGDCD